MNGFGFLPTSRFAILGFGVEGRAVLDYLLVNGCSDITVCDTKEDIEVPAGARKKVGDDYLAELDQFDVVFRSPGVPRDLAGLADAERSGVVITSATKEFFRRCPCTIVGITGSNGKTTTTALVAAMLRDLYGESLHVGGNDREPLLHELGRIQRDHVVVLELSSFQLQDLTQSPHVAVVLNITPNHLDIHATLEEYAEAKSQIVRHQTPADHAVLNWSFTRVRDLAQVTQAKVVYVNQVGSDDGAFLREGKIVVAHGGTEEDLMSVEALPVITNIDNVLAAATVARLFGIEVASIHKAIFDFQPVAHRMELVRELEGVRYYDDSASTTPDSTVNALRSFPEGKIVLIAGGTDKRLSYDMLAKELVRTQTRSLLIGQTRERIADAIKDASQRLKHDGFAQTFDTLEAAVAAARGMSRPGDLVILSPGCASFDMFKNAKHRGEVFQSIVRELA